MTLRREFLLGFLFWLSVVAILEPGNVMRALDQGVGLPVGEELVRLLGAGLLGAAATPAVFALTRHFPVEGTLRWRNLALHLGANAALAATLIVTSCILAAAILSEEQRPLVVAIREELAVDELLLFYCLAALTAAAHVLRPRLAPATPSEFLTHVLVKERSGETRLALASVDWIESQGNYLALHAGRQVHLIRETSTRFEAGLDPSRFVRIHRRTLVAMDRARTISPLPGGDATLRLDDGTELRVSRSYRDALRAQFEARSA
jgi:DNA-binding LytR/AlgR family response regulator